MRIIEIKEKQHNKTKNRFRQQLSNKWQVLNLNDVQKRSNYTERPWLTMLEAFFHFFFYQKSFSKYS